MRGATDSWVLRLLTAGLAILLGCSLAWAEEEEPAPPPPEVEATEVELEEKPAEDEVGAENVAEADGAEKKDADAPEPAQPQKADQGVRRAGGEAEKMPEQPVKEGVPEGVELPAVLAEEPNAGESSVQGGTPISSARSAGPAVFDREAGNVVDAAGAGAAGSAENIAEGLVGPPEDIGTAEALERPAGLPPDDDLFGHETRVEGELPAFAREHPDFIPDGRPGDMFLERGEASGEEYAFLSPLGVGLLPDEDVGYLLRQHENSPQADLPAGFARVVVPTGQITGSVETKQFHIEGGVIIYYQDVTISGNTADIDEKNEMAVLRGNVQIVDPKYVLKSDELRIFFEDKRFQALGMVQFKKMREREKTEPNFELEKKDRLREYFAGQQFELYCKELHYNWDSKEMTAVDGVRLVHPVFNGTMERIDYNDETKEYAISGKVEFEVMQYDWIFANQLTEAEDEEKVRSITDSPTKIKADRVVYSEESGIAQFYALPGTQVSFDQMVRKVQADFIEVNDETKDFYAEGIEQQVEYQQSNGDWLLAGGLIDAEQASEELTDTLAKPLRVHAYSLTYNFDRKRLELTGAAQMQSESKVIQADEIVQDETAKFFLLRGNVLIKPDAESEIYAAQVYLDTENDVFTFVGLVQGTLKSDQLPSSEEDEVTGEEFEAARGLFEQSTIPGVTGSQQPGGAGRGNVAEGN